MNSSSVSVAVIGCGSGGSTIADMLAKAGMGKLVLVDPDKLESGNLKRHVLTMDYVGMNKAEAMGIYLASVSGCEVVTVGEKFNGLPVEIDVVACCADSDLCCQLVNDYCLRHWIPAVYAGVYGAAETAEVITVLPGITPCYACYEREGPDPEPTQEKYTNPDYDPTKAHHHEGLWGDVLMAAAIQFRAILKVIEIEERIAVANKGRENRGIFYGCFGELWADLNPLMLVSLRPPYTAEFPKQPRGCAVCSDDFSKLTV